MALAGSSVSGKQRVLTSAHDIRDYALAHLGKCFFWVAGDALTIYILIRHNGYASRSAGLIFLAALLWNALCDVLVGLWADRRGAAGRSMAGILGFAAPLMGLAFAASLFLSNQHVVLTVGAALLFRTAFSVFDVPHNAMMARLSTTPALGVKIANLRTICSGIASLVVGIVAMPLLARSDSMSTVLLIAPLATVAVALMLPFLAIVPRLERLPYHTAQVGGMPSLGFVPLCVVTALGTIALGVLGKAVLHLDLSRSQWTMGILLALMLGRVVAVGVTGTLIARLGSAGALRVAYLASAVLILCLPLAVAADARAALAVVVVFGIASGAVTIVSWVILATLVQSPGTRSQRGALRFGVFTMIAKVILGVGGFLLGAILSYSIGAAAAEATMSPATLWGLCLVTASGTLLAAIECRVRT
ncbi:MAG: MFS transporter [Proteobacteria bacterium]|nr:MFS transporter [Pseudomonadota bacterium]